QLPGYAILILYPRIPFAPGVAVQRHHFRPVFGKLFPIIIHLIFGFAYHIKRNRGVGRELRSTIETNKFVTRGFEGDYKMVFIDDFGVLKYRTIKSGCLCSIVVKPYAGINSIFHVDCVEVVMLNQIVLCRDMHPCYTVSSLWCIHSYLHLKLCVCTSFGSSRTIEHPLNAERIYTATKIVAPKHILQLHGDFTAL